MRIFIIFFTVLIFSCSESSVIYQVQENLAKRHYDKYTLTLNRFSNLTEQSIIENYIKRHQIDVTLTDKGYYCGILNKGNGERLIEGSAVELTGEIYQIDNHLCYQYTEQNPLHFQINGSNEFIGLNSALQDKFRGDKLVVILPSFMGYGKVGDGKMIPPNTILVCLLTIK